jgi:CO/xanthine dehydrogenase FAD-binding subunit
MPKTLQEALALRAGTDAVPYGGGTDLMVENRQGVTYLFLNKLDELKQIKEDEQYIRIGGGVTFTQALASPLVPPLMKEAVSRIAAPAIRNMGTFAGNIGNGSAKADTVLVDFVADAKVRLVSQSGERAVDIEQLYLGRKKLDLRPDELIAEILLPKTGLENYYYKKVGGRNALAISRVSFAGVVRSEGNRITSVACAFGAVADTVLRYKNLEAMLVGKTFDEGRALKNAFIKAYDEAMVLTTGRVSAEYRKTVCLNLLADFLREKGI